MKKKTPCDSAKKRVLKHLKEDMHESRESIADDKKLKKTLVKKKKAK